MLFDRPSPSDLALNDYWNALNANAPGDELERLAASVEPMELAALHRARVSKQRFSPDPLFVRRLEDTLMTISATLAADSIPQAQPGSIGKRVDVLDRGRAVRPATGRTVTWTPSRAVAFIAVAAILLSIVAGIWLASRPNDDVNVIQPAGTPIVETTPDDGSDFPMYRGNSGRTGVVNAPGPSGSPVELWTMTALPASFTWSSAIVDGVLYAGGGDEGLIAVDALTGERLWSFQTNLPVDSGPAVGSGRVFFVDIDGTLFAVDVTTHEELWQLPGIRPAAAVALAGELVYAVTEQGVVYALHAATAQIAWSAELGFEPAGAPAVADGIVIQNSGQQIVHAFDALTGAERWTFAAGAGGGMATPTIAHGVVYATTDGDTNNMSAIDAETGQLIWQIDREVDKAFISATATVDRVYSVTQDGVLHALDAADGSEVWTYQLGAFVRTVPILAGNTLYTVDNTGFVRAISAVHGAEIWSYPVEGEFEFALSVAGEVVYTQTNIGNIYAITGDGSYASMVGAGLVDPNATEVAASPIASASFDPTAIEVVWATGPEAALTDGMCDVESSPLDGKIYVVDCYGHAIVIFAPDGTLLERWDDFGTEPGQFRFEYPGSNHWEGSIDFDADGNIFVFDALNNRVQKFSPDRTFITMWGEFGDGEGQFDTPYGVVDRVNERVYVSDLGNNRMQIFDLDGNFITMWGEAGINPGQLLAAFVALAPDGTLFLASPDRFTIQRFTVEGEFIEMLADREDGIGFAWGMQVDSAGNLWAASWDRNVIHVISPDGEILGEIREIEGVGPVVGPSAVTFDSEGNLLVTLASGVLAKLDVSGVFGG